MLRIPILCAVACSCAVVSYAQTPAPSFLGNWTLDISRSTSPPGQPLPKSSVMQVTLDDGRSFAWSQTTTGPDGKPGNVGFRGAFDGHAYPLMGGGGATLSLTRLSPTSFSDQGTDPGGAHWSETCSLDASQKTMTCAGNQSSPDGGTMTYTDVWTRG